MLSIKSIYAIVFSSLAGWALFSYFTTTEIIVSQKEYANAINIAGKQRMLSQKTALFAKRFFEEKRPGQKQHLRSLIDQMKNDHNHIIQDHVNSEKTFLIYHKEPLSLNASVNTYLDLLYGFMDKPDINKINEIQDYSFHLLPTLDAAVSALEDESNEKTALLMDRELFILLGTLLTLLVEAVFIVMPSIRQASRHERELNDIITERTVKLKKLSITDELTQLYNRRHINDILHSEVENANRYQRSFGVILFDIDSFKAVNDTYGHQTGDDVLQSIAAIMRKNMRKTDTIGRWGGEEFVIITLEPELDKLIHFAEKLRKAVESYEFYTAGSITCSFGVTVYVNGDTGETMISRADKAMYEAKDSGKNCIKVIHAT